MNGIHLQQALPQVFADRNSVISNVQHQGLFFHKGKSYLIETTSGIGESSPCSYIYGYRDDYQGIINFDETNIKAYSVKQWAELREHSLSMLFQGLHIFARLTTIGNIRLKNNLTGYKTWKEILALFRALRFSDRSNVKIGELSFGQQQRVTFIWSLYQPSDFIFLDEPINHLDDDDIHVVGELVAGEAEKQGAGIIVTSVGKHIKLRCDEILKL